MYRALTALALSGAASMASADAVAPVGTTILSVGEGAGALSVEVDASGAFGPNSTGGAASFVLEGGVTGGSTVVRSGMMLRLGDGDRMVATGANGFFDGDIDIPSGSVVNAILSLGEQVEAQGVIGAVGSSRPRLQSFAPDFTTAFARLQQEFQFRGFTDEEQAVEAIRFVEVESPSGFDQLRLGFSNLFSGDEPTRGVQLSLQGDVTGADGAVALDALTLSSAAFIQTLTQTGQSSFELTRAETGNLPSFEVIAGDAAGVDARFNAILGGSDLGNSAFGLDRSGILEGVGRTDVDAPPAPGTRYLMAIGSVFELAAFEDLPGGVIGDGDDSEGFQAPQSNPVLISDVGFGTRLLTAADGSTEDNPFLPGDVDPETGGFLFEFTPDQIVENAIFFIDPEIAVGYVYEVTGAEFSAVQAPSLAAVPNPGDYTLSFEFGGSTETFDLAPGALFSFVDEGFAGIDSFTITGIDVALALDPEDDQAFVTGIALTNIDLTGAGQTIMLSQTPLTVETDPGMVPVPLPAGLPLLAAGLLAMGALGLRRRRRV